VRTRAGADRAAGADRGAARTDGLAAHVERYLHELAARHASTSLQESARQVLAELVSHLRDEGVRHPRAVGEAHLVCFARRLRTRTTRRAGTPLSLSTQGGYLARVRGFFAWLERRRVVLRDPAREIELPRVRRLPRAALSEGQVRRLIASAPAFTRLGRRNRAILEIFYGTGIRLGECRRLDVTDYDPARGTLLVRTGKGRKDRMLPILGRAALALQSYLAQDRPLLVQDHREGALFLTRLGRRFSGIGLQALVRVHGRAAGISFRVSPHQLRHACATHLLQGGADVRHVQELLGHRDLDTTERYTHLLIRDLAKVISAAHPRGKRERIRA
jgi:integrase/recombinase XerD